MKNVNLSNGWIYTRADLVRESSEILRRGLGEEGYEAFRESRRSGSFDRDVVIQSSSGTTDGASLRIPRSLQDIADTFARTLKLYREILATAPERIAMIGGVSHTEAAAKFKIAKCAFISLRLSDLNELQSFDPEVISCYPSVLRELARVPRLALKNLNAFKLGGETLLNCDLELINKKWPGVAIFEQVGSTEMPAIAIGRREPGKPRALRLQTERFEFLLDPHHDQNAWQRVVARDLFHRLLFPIPGPYDTGDEMKTDGRFLYDIRRRNDSGQAFSVVAEKFLSDGAVNVQFQPALGCLIVEVGELRRLPETVLVDGARIPVRAGKPRRLPGSNKLPLVWTSFI